MTRVSPAGRRSDFARQLLTGGTAALAWWALARRLRIGRVGPGDGTHLLVCRVLCGYGLHATLSVPWAYQLVDRGTGVPNAARLLADCTMVYTAWSLYPLLPRVAGPVIGGVTACPGPLGSAPLAAGTVSALALCFGLARQAGAAESAPVDFTTDYGRQPAVLAYGLVQASYAGAAVTRGFLISRRIERWLVEQPSVPARWRLHSRLQTVGWALAVLCTAHDGVRLVVRYLGLPYPARQATLVAAAVRVIGSALIFNKMLPDFPQWGADYRAYRQLHPLWRDLHRADPHWILDSLFRPRWATWDDALAVNDIALRLERRTTEIRDGLRELAPYCDAGIAAEASAACGHAGLGEEAARPVIAAATIAAALWARAAGEYPNRPLTAPLLQPSASPAAEVEYLRRVGEAYVGSRIVDATGRCGQRWRARR